MNGKGIERRKEVWLNVSAGHPTGNAEAATLHAIGDREKEWMKMGWRERMNEKGMDGEKEGSVT